MTDPLAERLSARFRADAEALLARASVLEARGSQGPRGHGPSAAACREMADACERVSTLLAAAADTAALRAAIPELERLRSADRSADARNVYEGAVTRLRQALDQNGAAAHDDDEDDEYDEDDDEDEE
jgi:hypothetical protein